MAPIRTTRESSGIVICIGVAIGVNTAICVGAPTLGSSGPIGAKRDRVAEARRRRRRPRLRTRARVHSKRWSRWRKRPGGQRLEAHVVLGVRRGHDDRRRPGELEQHALEGARAAAGRGARSPRRPRPRRSPPAARRGRSASRAAASMRSRCRSRQSVEAQPVARAISSARCETSTPTISLELRGRRAARAAACPRRSRGRARAARPRACSAATTAPSRCSLRLIGASTRLLARRACASASVGLGRSSSATSRASASRVRLRWCLQVAAGDQLALGVRRQPALAVAQQLLDLVVADPVVLVVVEHRDRARRGASAGRASRHRAAQRRRRSTGSRPTPGTRSSSGMRARPSTA